MRRYLCDDTFLPRDRVAEILERSDLLDADGLGPWIIEYKVDGFVGLAGLEPVSAAVSVSPLMAGGVEPIIALALCFEGAGLAKATGQRAWIRLRSFRTV